MQMLHIAKLMALIAIGTTALPTSVGSEVYSRDLDQLHRGVSGSSIVNNPDSVAGSGRLEARSSGSSKETERERKKRLKAEENARIRQEQIDRSPYQCPYCEKPEVFSNSDALCVHCITFHPRRPAYNLKDPQKTPLQYRGTARIAGGPRPRVPQKASGLQSPIDFYLEHFTHF
ncbi:hypothetical protein PspLS_03345 [Pyricularia sp. CBS 133598]|nr:hypothetical protein PspLS_03345 [Pyricularia sp. CBS 133598]